MSSVMPAIFSPNLSATVVSHAQKELLAVATFLNHFRQYLIGAHFVIHTDHGALAWLKNFRSLEGQLARWLEMLQEYNFLLDSDGNVDAF